VCLATVAFKLPLKCTYLLTCIKWLQQHLTESMLLLNEKLKLSKVQRPTNHIIGDIGDEFYRFCY